MKLNNRVKKLYKVLLNPNMQIRIEESRTTILTEKILIIIKPNKGIEAYGYEVAQAYKYLQNRPPFKINLNS